MNLKPDMTRLLAGERRLNGSADSNPKVDWTALPAKGKHIAGYFRDRPALIQFLKSLDRQNLRYAVLFDDAGSREEGHVDILVSDVDAAKITSLVPKRGSGIAVFLFSETGLPKSNFRHMSLFPPRRAAELLDRSVISEEGIKVPRPLDGFLSTAYCALYFSGGLTGEGQADGFQIDAERNLRRAASRAGLDLPSPLTAGDIDRILTANGWTMPGETHERIAHWSPFAAFKAGEHGDLALQEEPPGVTLFFIRRKAISNNLRRGIEHAIEAKGFEILDTLELAGADLEKVATSVRGGNWGRGPFPESGGEPAVVLICHDLIPLPVSDEEREEFPLLDNGRIAMVKRVVRGLIERAVPPEVRFNPLHSTDNTAQSWRVVRWLVPQRERALRAEMKARESEFVTKQDIVSTLTGYGNRAKVELIRFDGRLAVKKTFRRSGIAALNREVEFLNAFAGRDEVPQILSTGPNFLIMPYYRPKTRAQRILGLRVPRAMKLDAIRQLAAFAKYVVSKGYDPIDMIPRNNVLVTEEDGLKVIDFEFAYVHTGAPPPPEHAYCFAGVPAGFAGTLPVSVGYLSNPYDSEWYPHTFLGLRSFLYDPPWLQQVKRSVNYPAYLVWLAGHKAIHSPRFGLKKIARGVRRRLGRKLLRR
jgi:hypothetical protein